MEPITLAEAKKHLRVEHDDEDDLIGNLITAAREYCEGFLNIALVANPQPIVPQKWKQAMLLLIGHWYEHRESVNVGNIVSEIPQGVNMLLWLDRSVPI